MDNTSPNSNTSSIQLFQYEGAEVRTVLIDGEAWFVAKDVCDILGYANARDALARHLDDDEKSTVAIHDGTSLKGGNPNMNIINESGLYCLILRSNMPEAKKFRRWVTEIVLPQVMRDGLPETASEKLTKTIMYTARMILDAANIKDNQLALALDRVAEHYTGQSMLALSGVVLEAPSKTQLLTPTEIGKHFGVSARKVNELLCLNGYQKREGKSYEPLESGEAYAVMLDTNRRHDNGTPVRQLKWESSFLTEIEDLLNSGVTQEA